MEVIIMKKFITKSKNNMSVYVGEETIEHMKAHSDVSLDHITEAIKKIILSGTFFMEEVNLDKIIGKDHCIYVSPENWENVTMVQRPNRKGLTPMIEAEPSDTSLITIGVCVDDDGLWTLFTAFYGVKAPKEPWDAKVEEKSASEAFWNCHALCH